MPTDVELVESAFAANHDKILALRDGAKMVMQAPGYGIVWLKKEGYVTRVTHAFPGCTAIPLRPYG